MGFSEKPQPKDSADAWIADAAVGPKVDEKPSTKPRHDPKAKPSKAFNLRLNDYELGLLQRAAEDEYCSQQAFAKRTLIRALEEKYAKAKKAS